MRDAFCSNVFQIVNSFTMQNSANFEELIGSVKRAGELLLTMWPGKSHRDKSLDVREKSDGTLVSQADLASNTILIEAITRLFPHDAILSEETPADGKALARAKRTWIIDPLDGTSSFLNGRDDFSVLVGLAEAGVPTLGVMFFPVLGKLVVSRPGQGALINGAKLAVSTSRELLPGRVYIRNFTCVRPELACPMMDSGLALLKVASGELDGAIIRMTTHREWDLAAPSAVLFSAGGSISDETGVSIRFGRGVIDFQYAIASNGIIHEQLRALIVNSRSS
jgi:3'-phosphoadenosine 5'-phosphosulfate (PAPS) 3'-phosphatase